MQRVEHNVFENVWTIVKTWLLLKEVPEYRFNDELMHVQQYMFGCCIALDHVIERADILPARMQQCLWGNVYSGDVPKDSEGLLLLTKYVVRQLGLMLQIEQDAFRNVQFKWAEFEF